MLAGRRAWIGCRALWSVGLRADPNSANIVTRPSEEGSFVRKFNVFGVGRDGRALAGKELTAPSPDDACLIAARMFSDCAFVEVWEETVLIARIRYRRG